MNPEKGHLAVHSALCTVDWAEQPVVDVTNRGNIVDRHGEGLQDCGRVCRVAIWECVFEDIPDLIIGQ
jgi:hypothetical protein